MKLIFIFLLVAMAKPNSAGSTVLEDIKNSIRAIIGQVTWNLDSIGIIGTTDAGDRFGHSLARGDFNGDGWQDLAIGIPYEDFFGGALTDSGAVLILYGSNNGLSTTGETFLYQTTTPNIDGVENDDRFGWSLASGDFNGDNFDDLAVGTPYEDVDNGVAGNVVNGGGLNIFYGSAQGLPDNSDFFHQGSDTQPGVDFVKTNDRFGWSLASGDFDDDGFADLAVSAPWEDFGIGDAIQNGGQVEIYYGSNGGITAEDRDSFTQNTFNILETSESQDRFGTSLAVGFFDNDDYADLAIGVHGEDTDGEAGSGAVQVIYGGFNGLTTNDELWSQSGSISGAVEAGDNFGYSVAAGDFNGDGLDDLLVGAYREDLDADGIVNAGAAHIIYGANSGLTATGNQIFHQNFGSITDIAEDNDRFGEVVTAGDLNYDGFAEAIIGVPNELVFGDPSGAVHMIFGSASGVITSGGDFYEVSTTEDDDFGNAVVIADFGNGPELAVGIPGDDSVAAENDTGSVKVFEFTNPDVIFENSFE